MPRFIHGKAISVFSIFYLSPCPAKLLSAVLCNQQKGLQHTNCWPCQHHKYLLQHNASVMPRWRPAVTFAEKRKSKDHQRQHTLLTTLNHHICAPWALFSIRQSEISEKIGHYSNAVFIFITQALTTFTNVALWQYPWWK
jgi:hypothetical protein